MMKPDHIVLDYRNYQNETELLSDLAHLLTILTRNRQVVVVREEEYGLYVIEHSSEDLSLGGPYPRWLTDEEYQDYLDSKNTEEKEN